MRGRVGCAFAFALRVASSSSTRQTRSRAIGFDWRASALLRRTRNGNRVFRPTSWWRASFGNRTFFGAIGRKPVSFIWAPFFFLTKTQKSLMKPKFLESLSREKHFEANFKAVREKTSFGDFGSFLEPLVGKLYENTRSPASKHN